MSPCPMAGSVRVDPLPSVLYPPFHSLPRLIALSLAEETYVASMLREGGVICFALVKGNDERGTADTLEEDKLHVDMSRRRKGVLCVRRASGQGGLHLWHEV